MVVAVTRRDETTMVIRTAGGDDDMMVMMAIGDRQSVKAAAAIAGKIECTEIPARRNAFVVTQPTPCNIAKVR